MAEAAAAAKNIGGGLLKLWPVFSMVAVGLVMLGGGFPGMSESLQAGVSKIFGGAAGGAKASTALASTAAPAVQSAIPAGTAVLEGNVLGSFPAVGSV